MRDFRPPKTLRECIAVGLVRAELEQAGFARSSVEWSSAGFAPDLALETHGHLADAAIAAREIWLASREPGHG